MLRLLQRIFRIGIEAEDDFETRITTRITNVVSLTMFMVAAFFSVIGTYLTGKIDFFVFSILVAIAYLMTFLINVTGYRTLARFMLVSTVCTHYAIVSVSVGPLSGVEFYLVVISIVPIFLFRRRERELIFASYGIVAIAALVMLVAFTRFEPVFQVSEINFKIGYYVTLLSLSVITVIVCYNLYFVSIRNYRNLREEKSKSDRLIYNMLPDLIAERLLRGDGVIADSHGDAAVLFSDIVGFAALSKTLAPKHLVELLNEIFSEFDKIAERRGIEKIKTIGDGYMAATGVLMDGTSSADAMVGMAKDMLRVVDRTSTQYGFDINIRIGIS